MKFTKRETGSESPVMLDFLQLLWHRRRFVTRSVAILTIVSALLIVLWPPLFKAEALLLPPQSGGNLNSMALGAMGGMASSGLASQLGIKNPADVYVGILKSRSIRDAVIEKNHLLRIYDCKDLSEARKKLESRTSIESTKESMIHISVEDRDPKLAAQIANTFTDELYVTNGRLAVTEAGQRRAFFEGQLASEKDKLADSEVELQRLQAATGLVTPAGQIMTLIQSQAQTEAAIASKRVELQALRSFATDANPQIETLQREISALKTELGRLQFQTRDRGNMLVSGTALVNDSVAYVRAVRNVKYHDLLFEMLARSLESSSLDEQKSAPILQVIDRAVPPTRKSWPPRLALILASAVASFLVVSLYCVAAELLRRTLNALEPKQSSAREALHDAAVEPVF